MSSHLPSQRIEVASERGVLLTWWYTVISIAFVLLVSYLVVLGAIFARPGPLGGSTIVLAVVLGVLLIVTLRYCWLLKPGLGSGLPSSAANLSLLVPGLLSLVLTVFDGTAEPFFLLPAWWTACFLIALLPRHGVLAAAAVVLFLSLFYWLCRILADDGAAVSQYSGAPAIYFWFMVLMVPGVLFGGLWWWDIVVQLNRSREAYGELSVAKERLRFASDLHDIQGHHLQVIALKTELAERVMDRDPSLAKQQIHEAQELARTALEDTRALVRGYRQVAFTTELKNAADVLEAASITTSVQIENVELGSEQGSLFGSAIRESTTNILRHSTAAKVQIRFWAEAGSLLLSVRNDGAAASAAGNSQPASPVKGDGTGLTAMSERLAAVGGSMEFGTEAGEFVMTVKIPEEK